VEVVADRVGVNVGYYFAWRGVTVGYYFAWRGVTVGLFLLDVSLRGSERLISLTLYYAEGGRDAKARPQSGS
jgi:hypothetical protein